MRHVLARIALALAIALAITLALALSGCATISLESTHVPPDRRPSFERTLAIVNLAGYDDSGKTRRAAETELARSLPELNITASSRLFDLGELPDIEAVRRRAAEEGFDGLVLVWVSHVTMNLAQDQESGAQVRECVDVTLKAAVAPLEGEDVWSGVIEKRNAGDPRKDVLDITRLIAERVRSDGLIAAEAPR